MRRRLRAFTLIEVLVALAVLAISLAAALRVGETGTSAFTAVRLRLLADWVASDCLAELRARREWPPVGVTEGNAQQAGIAFRWRQSVTETANPQFRRVAVTVRESTAGLTDSPLAEGVGFMWQGAR